MAPAADVGVKCQIVFFFAREMLRRSVRPTAVSARAAAAAMSAAVLRACTEAGEQTLE